jgi:hypothetical protein
VGWVGVVWGCGDVVGTNPSFTALLVGGSGWASASKGLVNPGSCIPLATPLFCAMNTTIILKICQKSNLCKEYGICCQHVPQLHQFV